MSLSKIAYGLIIATASVTILIFTKPLLMPFIIALIIWFLIKETKVGLKKVSFIYSKIPESLLTLIASFLIFFVLALIVKMITNNIKLLSLNLPKYEQNIDGLINMVNLNLDIDVLEYVKGFTEETNFSNLFKAILNSLSDIFSNAFLILIYVIFLILEEKVFEYKINAIYKNPLQNSHTKTLLAKIDKSIARYLTLKTIVSVMTGVLSYFALLLIGIDAPVFWAFLIFLLNYIPTVGSLIATLFPAVFAMLQFGDHSYFLIVLGSVGFVQILMGNLIEPKIMGHSLNISSLVVILSLSFWGFLWGIAGMILSVPITVIAIIMFAEIPQTRFIAIMLSERGEIGD